MTTKLRLNRGCVAQDPDKQVKYRGPGTFIVPDKMGTDRYLNRFTCWEPADAFDVDEFLDRDEETVVAELAGKLKAKKMYDLVGFKDRYQELSAISKWDDKIDELFEAEIDGKNRQSVTSLLRERQQKARKNDEQGKVKPYGRTNSLQMGSVWKSQDELDELIINSSDEQNDENPYEVEQ